MNLPEARWVFEVKSLCQELKANCQVHGNALTIQSEKTILRLTDFQNYLLINVGLGNLNNPHWIGFLTVPRDEIPEFLRNTLPLEPEQILNAAPSKIL
jgi:hypothetical protein